VTEQHSHEVRMLEQAAEEKQKQLTEAHHLTLQDSRDRHQQDLLAAKQHVEDELTNLQQVVCRMFLDRIC